MQKIVLQLNQVSKVYQLGEQQIIALGSTNLKIYEGEFVVIIGSSGSGKSTLLQVASLLDAASSGEVIINGTNTAEYNERQRAKLRNKEIGFIFQQFNLLKKTSALENVALPLVYANVPVKLRREQAKDMLEKVGLADRLGNTPSQLSGGQQQRVAIARALINNPSIIFADEPTGNLDSKSRISIVALLNDLHKEGKTLIMVTHDPEMALEGTRLITLKDGLVIEDKPQKGKRK